MKITKGLNLNEGYNEYLNKKDHPQMKDMEFGVTKLSKYDILSFNYDGEVVYTLMYGEITFNWNDSKQTVKRESCFSEGAAILHVPKNTKVTIECLSDVSEIAISKTPNEKTFEARILLPEDCLCANEMRGEGLMNDCSTRIVRTFFDRSTCKETNFFIGEVVGFPGKWSSFPPHVHVEPELYYYKFLPENGYGLAEFGEDAYKIRHNDLTAMPAHMTHAQTTAPGYALYYLWCIRLQDDENIITTNVEEHAWVLSPDAKFFPEV